MTRDEFYNQIAIALETGNVALAGDRMLTAYAYLPEDVAEELEQELTNDYYQFT